MRDQRRIIVHSPNNWMRVTRQQPRWLAGEGSAGVRGAKRRTQLLLLLNGTLLRFLTQNLLRALQQTPLLFPQAGLLPFLVRRCQLRCVGCSDVRKSA